MTDPIQKPKIIYPCLWTYAVIGPVEKEVRAAIASVTEGREHRVKFSKQSAGGKYTSLHVELTVTSEDDRNKIFIGLRSSPAIKTVL